MQRNQRIRKRNHNHQIRTINKLLDPNWAKRGKDQDRERLVQKESITVMAQIHHVKAFLKSMLHLNNLTLINQTPLSLKKVMS